MSIFGNIKVQLFILYVCIVSALSLRINVESTGYMSPDSDFYIRAANNVLDGKGFIAPTTFPFDETTPESHFAIWPVGYPAMIVTVCYITGLDSFVSSKLVNVIFLGFIFILLYHWYGAHSLLPACYFCSFGKLEIFSYTWSEGAFLFFLLWLLYLLDRKFELKMSYLNIVLLIFCLVAITFLRYAGLIYFFYITILIVIRFVQKKYDLAKRLSFIIAVSSLFVFGYLLHNYFLTGGFFGSNPRIFPQIESWSYFFKVFFNGLLNEFFLARNFSWTWDPLFVLMLFLQLLVCYYVFRKRSRLNGYSFQSTNNLVMISSGLFYLGFILVVRRISPFDTFDYRILAPFSTPIFITLLGNLRYIHEQYKINDLNIVIVSFFVLSLLMNLPKDFLLKWLDVI